MISSLAGFGMWRDPGGIRVLGNPGGKAHNKLED